MVVRRFHLRDESGAIRPIIYDRFGPQEGLFNFSWGVVADGPTFHLRCYQDAAFPRVNVAGEVCDLVLRPEAPWSAVRMYPNPVLDFIQLTFENYRTNHMRLRIWDAAGRSVADRPLLAGQPIDVRSLPAGLYLIDVQAGGVFVRQKFVKI